LKVLKLPGLSTEVKTAAADEAVCFGWKRCAISADASERITGMARKGLSHIALKVRDLKRTEEFYVGVLGMKVAFRHPPTMIFLTTPGSGDLLNFVKSRSRLSGKQGLEHLGFKVTPTVLKRTEKMLQHRQVAIAGRRGKSAFYIVDPNGYQIEYYCD
jgi:catechol 2,3-dioxygenase-like lactoylglutathione lyase family enzyme